MRIRKGLVRVARLQNEWYDDVGDPKRLVAALRDGRPRADILTFIQRLPDTTPRHDYPMEWDAVAAMEIKGFDHWWNNVIPKSARKHIRRSEKRGVRIEVRTIDDELVRGIKRIYDETPVRQGRKFGHYRKSIEELTRSHSTFPGRRDFVCAFVGDELIGFISLIYAGETARCVQLISMQAHRDKWPNNALLARAVKLCEERGVRWLVYGRYDYGGSGAESLVSFKEENGFSKHDIPRYYVPLTTWGRVALRLGLQRGLAEMLPGPLVRRLARLRSRYYEVTLARRNPPHDPTTAAAP